MSPSQSKIALCISVVATLWWAETVGKEARHYRIQKALTRTQHCLKYFLQNPKERWENQNIRMSGNLNPVVRDKERIYISQSTFRVVLVGPDFRSFVFLGLGAGREVAMRHLVFFHHIESQVVTLAAELIFFPQYLFGVLPCEENCNFSGRILSFIAWDSWLKPQTNLILKWCCIENSSLNLWGFHQPKCADSVFHKSS